MLCSKMDANWSSTTNCLCHSKPKYNADIHWIDRSFRHSQVAIVCETIYRFNGWMFVTISVCLVHRLSFHLLLLASSIYLSFHSQFIIFYSNKSNNNKKKKREKKRPIVILTFIRKIRDILTVASETRQCLLLWCLLLLLLLQCWNHSCVHGQFSRSFFISMEWLFWIAFVQLLVMDVYFSIVNVTMLLILWDQYEQFTFIQ